MMRFRSLLLAAVVALPLAPAPAEVGSPQPAARQKVRPSVLSDAERISYREIFTAIRAGDWAAASARLDGMGDGPLHAIARAELYLAKGSPKVELDPLLALIAKAPDMPEAAQLARLAQSRGATELPYFAQPQQLVWQGEQPRRARVRTTTDPAAATLEPLVQPLIAGNRPSEAEAYLTATQDRLSPEARTEYQQRIAWSYYIVGSDSDARRLAELARSGIGEWALQGEWVAGLAAWRQGDCNAAAQSFSTVAARASDPELNAAGHYWAARADMRCKRPERVQSRLRSAARLGETFYGLLAAGALGIRQPIARQLHDYGDSEWQDIAGKPNVKAAIALNEIGERGLADQLISHQAKIGGPADHNALLHLASDLDLAGTQFWLAHNAPPGARVNLSARYPDPDWKPMQGWRVDKALAFAHALQESSFRTQVVSPAGASGLMQVRPGTAGDMAKSRGEFFEPKQLSDPSVNLEYGQRYLEYLRDYGGTGGLLPKVIAAYNAGPAPVAEWNARAFDRGDPLLYIESIPYWETRGYVPIILRNYWVYEQKEGKDNGSRRALAQGLWPKFPGASGGGAVRLTAQEELQPGGVGSGSR
jgi:soluble lytic murein transglycosylase-like protein